MKFMVIVKASAESENDVMPTAEEIAEMNVYNEELVKAGIMVDGAGLASSANGARVQFSADGPTIVPGPFADPESLIAGYWIWEVDSLETALDWAKKAPFRSGNVEVRRMFGDEDFGDALTDDVRESQDRMREQIEAQHGKPSNG